MQELGGWVRLCVSFADSGDKNSLLDRYHVGVQRLIWMPLVWNRELSEAAGAFREALSLS